MTAHEDLANVEAQLKQQLQRVRLARQGLPVDGSVVTSQAEVARHFGVNRSTVHHWVSKGMPGEPGRYILADIEAWQNEKEAGEADPLLTGSSEGSPNLEEYRKWKAALARLEYEEHSGQLVSRDMVREALNLAATIFERCGEQLQRQFGPAARETMMDAVDDFKRRIKREFS